MSNVNIFNEPAYPAPVGYKLLIKPWEAPKQSKGGIRFVPQTTAAQKYKSVVGQVVAMGPEAYDKMAAPWCAVGDWVVHKIYRGEAINLEIPAEDGETEEVMLKVINDDEVVCVTQAPDAIVSYVQ